MRVSIATKPLALLLATVSAAAALAGTITVTSPNNGDFLGRTNQLRFNITGSIVRATVRATVVNDDNPNIKFEFQRDFNPDNENKITGSIDLNFAESATEGAYTITVNVTEPGNTYNTETRTVKIDVKDPVFREFQPIDGAFVRGIVPIRVQLIEPNIKEYRARINDQDIPNNVLTAPNAPEDYYLVNWDSSGIRLDGEQTINLKADDQANNSKKLDVKVTLDRIAPVVQIASPRPGQALRPRANIPVSIDITDQFDQSVDLTGVDVVARTLDGVFLSRVARRATSYNAEFFRWTGRLRWSSRLPARFKLVVTCVDKAGNVAATQEVIVTIGRGRGR